MNLMQAVLARRDSLLVGWLVALVLSAVAKSDDVYGFDWNTVNFVIVGCHGPLTEKPTLAAHMIDPKNPRVPINAEMVVLGDKSTLSSGVATVSRQLPPGLLRVTISTKDCYADTYVQVLPDIESRHKVVEMVARPQPEHLEHVVVYSYASLAGTLPFAGLTVGYVDHDGYHPALVDGQAYYFDSLAAGHYTIEIDAQNMHAKLPVEISGPSTIRNITPSELSTGSP